MLIDKAGVARLIPHAGAMCLLDGVVSWDVGRVVCAADSHRSLQNPLRRDGRLGVLCGVEYAAQAMAVHGALGDVTRGRAAAGYLASLRSVVCCVDRLDLVNGTLLVQAVLMHRDGHGAVYGFVLRHGERVVLEGRAAVVLGA